MYKILWFLAGLVSIAGGVFSLANPFAATLITEQLAGWMLAITGVLTVISAFGEHSKGSRLVTLFWGILLLLLGGNLLANPLQGVISLTIIAGVMLLVLGVLRLFMAIKIKITTVRIALIFSGIISLALGGMIFSNWPESAAVVLGLFLAIELISNGVSLILYSTVHDQTKSEQENTSTPNKEEVTP